MVYIHPLSSEEKEKLQKMTRQQIGRVAQRARAILLSNHGYTVQEIAFILERSDKTIRRWLRQYESDGCDGLFSQPRAGRPPTIDEKVKGTIELDMAKSPSECGYLAAFWTVGLLCLHLIKTLKIKVSKSTVRRTLHGLDYAFRRPRIAPHSSDPEAEAKMEHISKTMTEAPKNSVCLYEDESTFRLLPLIRSMWMKVGQQLRIVVPSGWNKCFRVFGALNFHTGNWHYSICEKARSGEFIAFLSDLLHAYPGQFIYLILDNGSIHHSKETQKWLSLHPRIQLLYLPKRSPQLNPVEKVWWACKDAVAANRYLSMARLKGACHDFFADVSPDDLLRLTSLAA
jgi:transposase